MAALWHPPCCERRWLRGGCAYDFELLPPSFQNPAQWRHQRHLPAHVRLIYRRHCLVGGLRLLSKGWPLDRGQPLTLVPARIVLDRKLQAA